MAVPPPPDLDDEDRKPSRAKLTLWLAWISGTLLVALLVNEITSIESSVARLSDDVEALEAGLDDLAAETETSNRNRRTEIFELAERISAAEAYIEELRQYHP